MGSIPACTEPVRDHRPGGCRRLHYLYEIPQQEILAARNREWTTFAPAQHSETAGSSGFGRRCRTSKPGSKRSLILPEEKMWATCRAHPDVGHTVEPHDPRVPPQPIATRELHAEWPIGLELEGTYHSLGAFLDRVSRFPRIINVGSLNITTKDDQTDTATIEVSCTATTFVLVDQSAAPPAGAQTGAPAKKNAPAQKTE
jgi:hypothetical protein